MDLHSIWHASNFLNTLKIVINTEEYVFVDWPDYLNTGDHLIWLGAKFALNQLGLRCIAEYTAWDIRSNLTISIPESATIICSGGGNFGDVYPNFQTTRELLAESFPKNRIVILPQTIHFAQPENAEASAAKFRKHPNLFVFGRDARSAESARQFTDAERAILAPDCALFLYPVINRIKAILPPATPAFDLLRLARKDAEIGSEGLVARGSEGENSVLAIDWLDAAETYESLVGRTDEVYEAVAPELARVFGQPSSRDVVSLKRLLLGISILELGSRVETDRLHAHILSCLLSKTHIVHDNSYGKNFAFYRCWTHTIPFAKFM
jgi:pyruvyl transferase EpsO